MIMTDHEKLVELLEGCEEICTTWGSTYSEAADYLIANGVTVRQPQKPLTVEEVKAEPDVVWVEWPLGGRWPCVIAEVEDDHCYFTDGETERMLRYGIGWRCWANRPTEEERQAAKWEDMES